MYGSPQEKEKRDMVGSQQGFVGSLPALLIELEDFICGCTRPGQGSWGNRSRFPAPNPLTTNWREPTNTLEKTSKS